VIETLKSNDSIEAAALDSLERELLFRKEASLRFKIREFVLRTLTSAGDPDANELARAAVAAYDLRSALVHEGTLPPDQVGGAIDTFRRVLERLFEAYLK